MRIVVIGGTGHVGTYMVPRLVALGHDVVVISRGQQQPYLSHRAWERVTMVTLDREAAEAAGDFGARIRDLNADVVIDMVCFTLESAQHLVEALRGQVAHFLHCGTIWAHGHSTVVPTVEEQARQPFGEYGIQKWAIEEYLLREARMNGFPATVLMPGHIVGPGHEPLSPVGNRSLVVYEKLARGEEVALPNLGMETVHHVHADDVAQSFVQALAHWSTAVGQNFHVVSSAAVTLRGFAEALAAWFGQAANLSFLPWDEWKTTVTPEEAEATWDHIAHSPNCSIAKAQRLIDYRPQYTSLQAVQESVAWLIAQGRIRV